jgi:arabinan endo-1,5-alpha-L-arabinosidase
MLRKVLHPLIFAICAAQCCAAIEVQGDVEGVHDPSIIKQQSTWYLFSTGPAKPGHIPIRCSTDLRSWKLCGRVFDELPIWATREIPGAKSAWAPDISYFDGVYRLYYAVSTFGHNDSAIGLATNKTLDSNSPEYKWVDNGMVMRSVSGRDDFNAIDPAWFLDEQGRQWLVFGSFWGGIKMRRVDSGSGQLSPADSTLYSLAARPHAPGEADAIEAPFVVRRDSFYYLFVSFDFCCRGVKSTYHVAVGRAPSITGPYLDASGKPMLEGGGTVLVAGTDRWRGPGHEAVLLGSPDDLLVFHAYDGVTGKSALRISTLTWDDGWPHVAKQSMDTEMLLDKAESLVRAGNLSGAEETARRCVEATPASARAHYLLGYILFRENKPKESLAEYTTAARYKKPDAFQLEIVALNYVLLGDFVQADKWLTLAVQWDPKSVQAWYHLGRTKYNENRFDEAISAFQRCLELDPGNVKAQDNMGLSYEGLGRSDAAIAAYRKAIALQEFAAQKEAGPYIDLGTLLVNGGHLEEGVSLLIQSVEMAPSDVRPHRELGKTYLRLNQLDKAQSEFEAAIRLEPDSAPVHCLAGQVYRKQGSTAQATIEFEKCKKLNDPRH